MTKMRQEDPEHTHTKLLKENRDTYTITKFSSV